MKNELMMAVTKPMRTYRVSQVIPLVAVWLSSFACPDSPVFADDWHVDAVSGDDRADGSRQPVKTIAAAIRRAKPGDTIHLRPETYRDWAAFFDKGGEPGKPITLDGHGATLDGCEPLDPKTWAEVESGLFRHDDLLPLTDAIIDRWFFVMDGKLNRMRRCSKGPSEPLKSPRDLQPGEWTFVKDADRTKAARAGYIATGICDTGHSETSYRRVLIRDCIGFDLFFLDTGNYSVSDSVVISLAAKAVYLQGRDTPAEPCRLTLDNVLIRRERTENEVRISANCKLTARRATFLNLDLQATGGAVEFDRCFIGGTIAAKPPRKPQMHLWKDATWRGGNNWYDLGSVRVGQSTFTEATFAGFQNAVLSDRDSRWKSATDLDLQAAEIGSTASLARLGQ